MADQDRPNQSANQEPAEGSRETVEANLAEDDAARDRFDDSDTPHGDRDAAAGGITNRPLDEEIENQREVPERGTAKKPQRDHA